MRQRPLSVRHALVWLAALLVLGGCAATDGEDEAADQAGDDSSSELFDGDNSPSRSVPANVSVTVSGATSFTWEEETDLHILVLNTGDGQVNLLNVGFADMHALDEGGQFRWSLDLVGEYDGPGSYQIHATHGPDKVVGVGAGGGVVRSTAFLWHLVLADGVEPHEPPYTDQEIEILNGYERVYANCTLEVGEDEQTGSLVCPDLRSGSGSQIALDVAWELLET